MTIWTHNQLAVDGDFGFKTAQALQIYLKNYGDWRSYSYDLFYRGVIDGDFGPRSKRGLQRYLAWHGDYHGAIDGWIGPQCREALLNHDEWAFSLDVIRPRNTGFKQLEDAIRNAGWPKYDPTWDAYTGTKFLQAAVNGYHDTLVLRYPMHRY